jgi:hypothetical protein
MSTDSTPQKRKPTGSANSTAGGTDREIFAGQRSSDKHLGTKEFRNLSARFALQGHALYRTDPADGRVLYFIERLGLIQLTTLDIAMDILAKLEARR